MPKKESFMKPSLGDTEGDANLISSKVARKVNKRKGELNTLSRDEKMLCALRKALASKSGLAEALNARYYISGEQVYVTSRGGGAQTKKNEPTTYTASGRFKLGMAYKDSVSYRMAQFSITFRDSRDDRGLPDVDFIEPTTIDLLPKSATLVPPQAA